MLGADILVAPVLYAGQREREVWLPAGETWVALNGERYEGGRAVTVAAPMSEIPVFIRGGADASAKAIL